MENYLQRAWSDALDNVDVDEIKDVIAELQDMDDEHGAFWVSVIEDEETILEVDKDMKMVAIFRGDVENSVIKKVNTWDEVLSLYELLLAEDFDSLLMKMRQ
jgi:flagellar basal body rod protein FlgF